MIKLQLLLQRPSADITLDPDVRAAIEAHGLTITAFGRATVSAEMSVAAFENLFGTPAGAAPLPVPPGLQSSISLITFTPRHSVMRHPPRVKHAAI